MRLLNKTLFFAFGFLAAASSALAASFTISTASTTKQTLAGGESGVVTSTGSLTVTGNNVAITVTGSSTITNNGSIQQTTVLTGGNAGNGRVIRDNTGGLTLTVNNGSPTNSTALMQTVDADVIQMKVGGSIITLNNYGTINSQNSSGGGNQALDWNALTASGTSITNTVTNFSTGIITATEADAIRPGVNGVVNNDGLIKSTTTTGSSSDGVDAQTNSGIQVVNAYSAGSGTGTGTIEGGHHGITGGDTTGGTYIMSVTNNLGGTIKGDNGSGINIDGINANEVVAIVNHGTITGNGVTADGDGVDVDGLVNLTNTGLIKSLNALNDTSEGVTVGGGTINNSGTIQGSIGNPTGNTGVGRGITIAGVDKDSNDNPIPIQAPYAATTITNSGTIKGDSDSGIAFTSAIPSGFLMTITNQTGGLIEGGGATAAAIQAGPDNFVINNSGTIKTDSSGKAIALGSGNNTLYILGGAASIIGDVDGGTGGTNALVIDPGTNNTFSYAGAITHFATAQVKSGTFNLSGTMTAGATAVNGGTLAGNGTVNGLVTVSTGGVISPGNSPGKLTLQTGVNFSSGGKYFWQLASLTDDGNGVAGTDFDQILLTGGNLTLGGTSLLTLDFSLLGVSDPNSANTFWLIDHSWTIIDNGGTATNTGSTNFSQITDPAFADGSFTTSSDANGNTVLSFHATPEPGSASLLILGGLGLIARRRRV
ncbi:MAG: PEP-CTERM sorting domain-containing protein [Chthoniobacter sp.]|uniref:beta strand repeat-containing protein n=1 Tax=Chthoniobacter sp. TaxID=2510640 RepID=UPI0032AA11E7